MNRCNICGALFEDEWLLVVHQELYHNSDNIGIELNKEEIYQILQDYQNYQNAEEEDGEEEMEAAEEFDEISSHHQN